jgi:Uma2 family endonuclease
VTLTIQLPRSEKHTEFNLRRWSEILTDPELAKLPHRIETDRYGHILMSPPPAPFHGTRQARIAQLLAELLTSGRVITECPVSTVDGVKAIDVAWLAPERVKEISKVCLERAPEICVEVVSPSNTKAEMQEKLALYFEAGAREVWLCQNNGKMGFYSQDGRSERSTIAPTFPTQIRFDS